MGNPKKRYTPAPAVPAEMTARLAMILEVLAGQRTVSEAARELGMSRNHFQTILHRGLAGLTEAITPKAPGRPPKPSELLALQEELERLKRENSRLQDRVGTTDRLLQAASGLLQGRIRPARQSHKRRPVSRGDEDAEGEPSQTLARVEQMRACGLPMAMAASIAGVHPSTLRRWRHAQPRTRPTRERPVTPHAARQVREQVEALHGLVGAESLRRSVPEVSRRQAARLKHETVTDMERRRKAASSHVHIAMPGVMRGMDAMHLRVRGGCRHTLIAADSAIPFRTSATVGERYDTDLVLEALEADIARHGAPLVYRLDRAKAHVCARVREFLDSHEILVLHGPPHLPRFYGQLERQNRDHRAWLDAIEATAPEELPQRIHEMIDALNERWRIRSLAWRTPAEVWQARPTLCVDRAELALEVNERAARIARRLQLRRKPADLALRLAIEQALESRGYLSQSGRGWC